MMTNNCREVVEDYLDYHRSGYSPMNEGEVDDFTNELKKEADFVFSKLLENKTIEEQIGLIIQKYSDRIGADILKLINETPLDEIEDEEMRNHYDNIQNKKFTFTESHLLMASDFDPSCCPPISLTQEVSYVSGSAKGNLNFLQMGIVIAPFRDDKTLKLNEVLSGVYGKKEEE